MIHRVTRVMLQQSYITPAPPKKRPNMQTLTMVLGDTQSDIEKKTK